MAMTESENATSRKAHLFNLHGAPKEGGNGGWANRNFHCAAAALGCLGLSNSHFGKWIKLHFYSFIMYVWTGQKTNLSSWAGIDLSLNGVDSLTVNHPRKK